MLRATFSTSERTCCIAIDSPAMRPSAALAGAGARRAPAARGARARRRAALLGRQRRRIDRRRAAPPRPSAEATTARNCFRSTGLVR